MYMSSKFTGRQPVGVSFSATSMNQTTEQDMTARLDSVVEIVENSSPVPKFAVM